ncbi:MATE family transporter, multltidrug/sodium efflux pump, putative [Candida dubliniensis CD36]|uniref:MATE family transporter, multltidrug/sodium efflux pump, putative n=1 Tax=Candida dubliniensis (strain CD36 / ATCC MYA-646 / CBS 7987 / NCPF 3949 / NRRL Y-17841) TaxID=573826 RepID=B9W6N4_CANDC|nr:MATE family transporter, multltidrug/sodium efflux pump, putative [Candida dubliniensis CD36]CAX44339.1 MATE family transporter, multltidrug/sodium efflux pump, putative [Candida dubliniensis CD36]
MSDENEITPLLFPFTSHRSRRSSKCSEIDENEIVSYVQQRRQSIASVGHDKIPKSFALPVTTATGATGGGGTTTGGTTTSGVASPRLTRSISRSSLISGKSYSINDIIEIHQQEIDPEPKTTIFNEIKVIIKYSLPLIITFLLQYSLTVASVFSVGRLGSTELAAVSLSSMTANISGYAIIQGVSTCLDTLCAQAFGRKDYNSVGVHFIRCNYLLLLLYIPMAIFWVFGTEPLLILIIGEESIAMCKLAGKYLKILTIGLPGFILFENAKHFLQTQGIFHASTLVLIICAPLNGLLNYLLVWNKSIGLGFIGAPISVIITNWIMCFMLYGYIFFIDGYQCWPQQYQYYKLYHKIFFQHWNKMIKLSIPGVLMVEAEWLAFEIITFQAAKFGTEVLAAQSIISTTCVIFYQIPFALSIAAGTRIAWYIGAASKTAAKKSTYAVLYTATFIGFFNCGFMLTFRHNLASLYSEDNIVIELATKVLIVGSIYQINDCLSCATAGVLRGQGRQMIGGMVNLIGYYLIALPFAYTLAFIFQYELLGLWFGMIIALIFVSFIQTYFVITSNWKKIIDDCIEEAIIEDGNLNIDAHSILPSMSNSIIV